jgi:hypothetical protein
MDSIDSCAIVDISVILFQQPLSLSSWWHFTHTFQKPLKDTLNDSMIFSFQKNLRWNLFIHEFFVFLFPVMFFLYRILSTSCCTNTFQPTTPRRKSTICCILITSHNFVCLYMKFVFLGFKAACATDTGAAIGDCAWNSNSWILFRFTSNEWSYNRFHTYHDITGTIPSYLSCFEVYSFFYSFLVLAWLITADDC